MVIMIILLILCLPLILMLSLFTTTNVVAVVAEVPVTGIVLNMDKSEIPVLNLDKEDRFIVDYTVMPQGASNKEVTYKFYDADTGEEADRFTVDGKLLTPTTHGKTKVTVETVDGGFRESFIIYVTTNRVTAIDCALQKESIFVGEVTGIDTLFTPASPSNQSLNYTVKEGEDVVKITNGKIKGIGIGTAVIEISSGDKPEVKDEVVVTVGSSGVFDYVDDRDYLTVLESFGALDVVVNPDIEISSHAITLTDTQGLITPEDIMNVWWNETDGKLEYEFSDTSFIGEIEIALTMTPEAGESVTKLCTVTRLSDVEIAWAESSSQRSYPVYAGESIALEVNVQPKVADVTYTVTVDFTAKTDLVGTVKPGDVVTLEEGKRYTCDGGYISFMVLEHTIYVFGERTVDDLAKIGDTLTSLKIVATDNSGGKTVNLRLKKITVIPGTTA